MFRKIKERLAEIDTNAKRKREVIRRKSINIIRNMKTDSHILETFVSEGFVSIFNHLIDEI